jgi:F-type H+-transporting ATPase subunit gamma
MASTIALKQRIKSIKGTRQITKAMQLVSASKLRRAQEYAMASRAYADLAAELLARLSGIREVEQQPLFRKRPVQDRMYIIVTSNSGLAGAYNANVLKTLTKSLQADRDAKIKSQVIAVGSKGAQFVRRLSNVELVAVYPGLGDQPSANDIRPLLNTILEHFKEAHTDEVRILYTKFISTVSQQTMDQQVLPATAPEQVDIATVVSNFEPDVETVIEQTTTRLIEAEIWQAVLESLASEHAMRMVAMKNATDNANDLIGDLRLTYNGVRQANITRELAEISAGSGQ